MRGPRADPPSTRTGHPIRPFQRAADAPQERRHFADPERMKILIIKLGALGDVIMATAFVRQLCADYSAAEVWLLTVPAFAPLFTEWPGLHVHSVPRQGALATWRTLWWLRRQRFDRLYDLQSNGRTRVWTALSRVPERIGNHPYFPYTLHPPQPYVGQCHAFDRINEILTCAGHRAAPPVPFLPASPRSQSEVDHWLQAQQLTGSPLVLLHAGASAKHPGKRWPHYLALAQALAARGLHVVWLGAAEDAALNQALARTIGHDATSQFTVEALAELGRRARFAVTNDSAPMHILSCAGIPVFGLFGPTDWRRTHALGQAARVITRDTAPSRALCRTEERQLDRISVAMVLAKLTQSGVI